MASVSGAASGSLWAWAWAGRVRVAVGAEAGNGVSVGVGARVAEGAGVAVIGASWAGETAEDRVGVGVKVATGFPRQVFLSISS